MKKTYLYFLLLFCLYAALMMFIRFNREKEYKTDELRAELFAYARMSDAYISRTGDTLSVVSILPDEIRITIIDYNGGVRYDNKEPQIRNRQNHAGRPEIIDARLHGSGYAIRNSVSLHADYLYYAYKCHNGSFIRLALPYEVKLIHAFDLETVLTYVLALLLVISVVIILYGGNRLEQSRLQTASEKERNKRIKREMTNNIAHELKTPVSSIRGFLEILSQKKELPADKRDHYVERAYVQTLRLSELINDIALLTKLDDAVDLFPVAKVNLYEAANDAVSELEESARSAGIALHNGLPASMPLNGNRNLLFSIFRNLLENTIRYAGEGAEVYILADTASDSETYHLTFYDTGHGVATSDLERIFDRFVCLNDGRDRSASGTGLGLAIVKHAVMFHGGSIKAYNRKEGGLAFRFTLKKNTPT